MNMRYPPSPLIREPFFTWSNRVQRPAFEALINSKFNTKTLEKMVKIFAMLSDSAAPNEY